MCVGSEFQVDGAETENAREVKLLVMPVDNMFQCSGNNTKHNISLGEWYHVTSCITNAVYSFCWLLIMLHFWLSIIAVIFADAVHCSVEDQLLPVFNGTILLHLAKIKHYFVKMWQNIPTIVAVSYLINCWVVPQKFQFMWWSVLRWSLQTTQLVRLRGWQSITREIVSKIVMFTSRPRVMSSSTPSITWMPTTSYIHTRSTHTCTLAHLYIDVPAH